MSDAISRLRCHCGKTFKDSQAMMQHTRDSPRHPRQNATPPPAPDGIQTCGCGSVFKTAEALHQHKRDSPFHAQKDTARSTGGIMCSCGKIVKNENGMKSHLNDSRHHKLEESCAGGNKADDGNPPPYREDGASNYQWANDAPRSPTTPSLWQRPVAFVGAGTRASTRAGTKAGSSRGRNEKEDYGVSQFGLVLIWEVDSPARENGEVQSERQKKQSSG
ncbi:hypothetical protein DL770_010057 [Monosporascus sp. CRB-9-2]|nr:hypothetical protein DL770_010057 [Monosporascus sp. CRB-9-2]